jgi:ribosomal protein S18 acetylase RimI-like enzyme
MQNVVIRKVREDEVAQLRTIGRLTFHEAFADQNNQKDMEDYLDSSFATEKLKKKLNDPNTEYYFGEMGDKPIAYLKINKGSSQTDLHNDNALEIERIYVIKAYQGRKIGQLLYEKALQLAQAYGVDFIWLGVWEKNQNAIGFYQRHGFEVFVHHDFVLGSDRQTDLLMKKSIS